MKKLIFTALLGFAGLATAQVSFAAKAHLLVPTSKATWTNFVNSATATYTSKGENSAGFNVGFSAKVDLPVTSLFLMPEIYYTHFKNEYTEKTTNTSLKVKSNRVDVPVLVGYNILTENFSAFAGPVASYSFGGNETFDSFKENSTKNFTVGYQIGAQATLSKLILSARYEGAFTKNQRKFINAVSNTEVTYDNRPSFFLLGLGYKF